MADNLIGGSCIPPKDSDSYRTGDQESQGPIWKAEAADRESQCEVGLDLRDQNRLRALPMCGDGRWASTSLRPT